MQIPRKSSKENAALVFTTGRTGHSRVDGDECIRCIIQASSLRSWILRGAAVFHGDLLSRMLHQMYGWEPKETRNQTHILVNDAERRELLKKGGDAEVPNRMEGGKPASTHVHTPYAPNPSNCKARRDSW